MTPVILVGGGGHAKVLIDVLRRMNVSIRQIVDPAGDGCPVAGCGIPIVNDEATLDAVPRGDVDLAIAVGGTEATTRRKLLFEKFSALGFSFATIIHPSAIIADSADIAMGAQIMAGVVIQPGCRIGVNAIINTRASIDHDCVVEDHVHIAPGVTLSGGVHVASGSHIGIGATVLQNIKIGAHATVGAGSVVIRDVPDNTTVVGVPARQIGV